MEKDKLDLPPPQIYEQEHRGSIEIPIPDFLRSNKVSDGSFLLTPLHSSSGNYRITLYLDCLVCIANC